MGKVRKSETATQNAFLVSDQGFNYCTYERRSFDFKKSLYPFQVGSAITYDAIAEKEFEECFDKGKGFESIIGASTLTTKAGGNSNCVIYPLINSPMHLRIFVYLLSDGKN